MSECEGKYYRENLETTDKLSQITQIFKWTKLWQKQTLWYRIGAKIFRKIFKFFLEIHFTVELIYY